jgi:hypothetical protein
MQALQFKSKRIHQAENGIMRMRKRRETKRELNIDYYISDDFVEVYRVITLCRSLVGINLAEIIAQYYTYTTMYSCSCGKKGIVYKPFMRGTNSCRCSYCDKVGHIS